ncbi:MAG: hypothetical protein JWR38_927 [Mucilaginibacter sp.]|nr:hypothetical protein [Mucilaginibacter sp.]
MERVFHLFSSYPVFSTFVMAAEEYGYTINNEYYQSQFRTNPMPLQTTMTGFDMVWAITQNTVNSQLDWLSGQTIPTQVTIGDINNDAGAINGTIAPPTVSFDTGEPHLAYLYLTFSGGTFTYWSGYGKSAIQKNSPIAGWKIAFSVHLNIAQIAQDFIKDGKAIPQEIKDMLTNFDSTMFSIQSIFMDFENSDLSTYNDLKSSLPGATNQVADTFNSMLRVWLLDHKGSDNPFILGFPVTAKQPTDDVKAVFNPTGANLSTHAYEYPLNKNDGSKDGLSTLNFLLVTGNRSILDDPALMRPDAGSFHKNLVETNDIDGKAFIAQEVFFEKYLNDLIIKPLGDKLQTNPDYVNARPDRSPDVTTNDKTHGFVFTDSTWKFGDHVVLEWEESGNIIHKRVSEQNLQYAVTTGTENDASGGARLTINIDGSIYRYEHDTVYQDWGKLGKSYYGDAWASAKLSFNIKFQFIAGTDGKITITHSSIENPQVLDHGQGGIYDFADFFSGILGLHTISDDWDTNAASLGAVDKGIADKLVTDTGPILESAMTKVILPGRKEFFYKNIQLNSDFDVEIDFAYKSA